MADKFEIKDNTGSMFKNDNPKNEKSASHTGRVKIEGKEYWINGWVNESKNGRKYFGLTFKPCESQGSTDDGGSW